MTNARCVYFPKHNVRHHPFEDKMYTKIAIKFGDRDNDFFDK